MATQTLATRRGVLKWLPAVGVAAAAPALRKPELAASPSIAEQLLADIAETAPQGHRCLAVTVKQGGTVEAFCVGPDGAHLYRNPNTGKWV